MTFMPLEWECLRAAEPRLPCYTTWCASIIRCRFAHLVLVQPNHLLPAMHAISIVPTAASTAKPPRQAIASLRKSEVDGDCVRLPNRRQSDSEDRSKPNRLAPSLGRHYHSRGIKVIQPPDCQSKAFLLGFQRGHSLLRKRMAPLIRAAPAALLFSRAWRGFFTPFPKKNSYVSAAWAALAQ